MISCGGRSEAVVAHGAKTLNLSLGGAYFSQTICDAVSYAQGLGALVVAAAGNDGKAVLSYPADCNAQVLKVGATGNDDDFGAHG